jgi:AcrR family transcriptional regulator
MTGPAPRSRGRPRSLAVDRALDQAARDEFVEKGLRAMSMEAIAARAGVSKVSLYRRWKSKLAATADVLRLLAQSRTPEDHGSLEADVLALVRGSIESDRAKASTKMLMRTMGEISEHPELLALYRTHVLSPRVEQIRALVERARERGEIGDTPTDIAAAMIAGPLFLHALTVLADADVRVPDRAAEALTRAILEGIRRDSPAPGPPTDA